MPRRPLLARLTALVGLLLAALGATTLAPAPARAADAPLPVPYGFLPAAILGGTPGADAPGTNDFTCKPTAAHPRPVVLVHGLLGNKSTNWPTFGPLLKNEGYCVFALTYGVQLPIPGADTFGGVGDMRVSARELAAFVDKVLAATGASKVDLVGHSEGTVMPQYYLKFLGGAAKVKNYIGIASLYRGTAIAGTPQQLLGPLLPAGYANPLCVSCLQFSPTSDFYAELNSGNGILQPGVTYTSIVTKYDELVIPYTSGIYPGVTNIVLQDVCPTDFSEHFQIVSSRTTAQIVLNTLDPQRRKPVTCSVVLPFVGELVPGLL